MTLYNMFMKHIYLSVLFIVMTGCSSKTTSYTTGLHVFGHTFGKPKKEVIIGNPILAKIAHDINTSADITHISLYITPAYLKINFKALEAFKPTSTLFTRQGSESLHKIIPLLKNHPGIIIQAIGHAYDEGSSKEMQHISDNRAITVAGEFYNAGLKEEILAKGCSNTVPLKICDNNHTTPLCAQSNRRVDIFIYPSKQDVITKCR